MTSTSQKTHLQAVMLLVLFLSFQAGRMLCYHTHVYGNVVVSHSHPFAHNQHNEAGLLSIASIDFTSVTDEIIEAIELPIPPSYHICINQGEASATLSGYHCNISSRAPPIA